MKRSFTPYGTGLHTVVFSYDTKTRTMTCAKQRDDRRRAPWITETRSITEEQVHSLSLLPADSWMAAASTFGAGN